MSPSRGSGGISPLLLFIPFSPASGHFSGLLFPLDRSCNRIDDSLCYMVSDFDCFFLFSFFFSLFLLSFYWHPKMAEDLIGTYSVSSVLLVSVSVGQ